MIQPTTRTGDPGDRLGCGATIVPDARFCDACGAPLAERPAEKAIARRVVTVVFADLIGSVSLHERLDAESARRFVDRYHRAMTAAVEVHGGKVVQLLGDGVLAAFGVPRVAEDDAIRAVRAGLGMQRAFRELMREQRDALDGVGLRVAVNTGEGVVSDDETAVIGDPTSRRGSSTRRETAPVARSARDPNDANRPDVCAVSDECGARDPESTGRGPELG